MAVLLLINSLVYTSLGAIHFYWGAGGKKWSQDALPQFEPNGKPVFTPGMIPCLIVGIGLSLFALFTWACSLNKLMYLSDNLVLVGNAALAFIFLARFMGDFKYVGFFKKIHSTEFARKDTQFYTPLCLYLGLVHAFYVLPLLMGEQ